MALCRECGREFEPWSVWDIYCSPECARAEWLRESKTYAAKPEIRDVLTGNNSPTPHENSPTPHGNSPTPHENSPTPPEGKPCFHVGVGLRHLVCPVCGKAFMSNQPAAKYCSKGCKKKAAKLKTGEYVDYSAIVRSCAVCGKEFTSKRPQTKYCSFECHEKARYARVNEYKRQNRARKAAERKPVSRTCSFCGEQFETKNATVKICDKCRSTAIKDEQGHYLILRKCAVCGKEFRTYHTDTLCCSKQCSYKCAVGKNESHKRVCEQCGKEFVSSAPNVKCCSDECRKARKKALDRRHKINPAGKEEFTKTCLVCKRQFTTYEKDAECCSAKCRGKRAAEKRKGTLHTCPTCGKLFGSKFPAAKYCSANCRKSAKAAADGMNTCTVCGKAFHVEGKHSRKYCSEECRKKAINAYSVQRSMEISRDLLPPPTRRCHDCGAPTDNYRCKACLAKWRAQNSIPLDGGEAEEMYAICR